MKFRVEHLMKDISLANYEKLYFDEEFNTALCKAVKLSRTLDKRDLKDGFLKRSVRVGPEREIPAPVAKILGASRIEYTEHLEYKMGSNKGTWKTVSSIMTDKVESSGTFEFKEHKGGVQRIVEGDIRVKIFGVGGIVEKFIVADVEKSYADAAQFTQKWISDHNS